MPHSKEDFRKCALQARSALGSAARAQKSAAIVSLLRNWQPYRRAQFICLYASFGSEVQTGSLLTDAYGAAPQVRAAGAGSLPPAKAAEHTFCLPRIEGNELVIHRIEPVPHTATAQLVLSPMGMPEPPAHWPMIEPQSLDVILVPGSAFSTLSGHRLGYGKGFYDRLLARAPQALKVGLCFDVQLFSDGAFPVEPHDIALDALISESGIREV